MQYNNSEMGRINKRTQQSRMAGRSGGRPKTTPSIPEIGNHSIGEEVIVTEEIQALGKYPSCVLTLISSWVKANMSLIENACR